jgi:hypothetical protein
VGGQIVPKSDAVSIVARGVRSYAREEMISGIIYKIIYKIISEIIHKIISEIISPALWAARARE